jgi:YD repeat-containing protein
MEGECWTLVIYKRGHVLACSKYSSFIARDPKGGVIVKALKRLGLLGGILVLGLFSFLLSSKAGELDLRDLRVTGYSLVSKYKLGPCRLYTYKASLTNFGSKPALAVKARLESHPHFTIPLDGGASFGEVSPGVTVTSKDTFSILQLFGLPFDPASLGWVITGNTPSQSPPLANAGADQTVFLTQTVQLDGSRSSDPDGDPLTFEWSFVSIPEGSGVFLSDESAANPIFYVDQSGSYVVQLIVNDGSSNSAPDTVMISTENSKPVAHAGPDQTAFLGSTVTLDGSRSSDVDGNRLTFNWSIVSFPSGSSAYLSDPSQVKPYFEVDTHGNYVVQLIVNDGELDSTPSTVTITTENSKPVADAGIDQTVFVGDTVSLDGSRSHDADGAPLAFKWSFTSVPSGSGVVFSDPLDPNPTFLIDTPGIYVAQLIVSDGELDSLPSTVTITTENSKPRANAGEDQEVFVGETVTLDGTASSDSDHDPLTYGWSFTALPLGSNGALSDPVDPNPSFMADVEGTYVIQLIVDDGNLSSDPDTVTVNAAVRMVQVPNVAGMSPEEAQSAIMGAQLLLGSSTMANSDTVPIGSIISQSPAAGSSVPQWSSVDLVISLGPPTTTVPDVVGMGREDGEAAILASGLSLGAVTTAHSNTVPEGSIISQNPVQGTEVYFGTGVDFVISLGPDIPPSPDGSLITVGEVVEGRASITGGAGCVGAGLEIRATDLATGETRSVSGAADGSFTIRIPAQPGDSISLVARNSAGNESPPVVVTVPKPLPPAAEKIPEGSFGETYRDLVPQDATIEEYDLRRLSLLTGLVQDTNGGALTGVIIRIHGHPEYGSAATDAGGRFTIPAEGGGVLTVTYQREDLITAHRQVQVPWNGIAIAETLGMIPQDALSTTITFDGNPGTIVAHKSSEVSDSYGTRSCTLVFSGDNRAYSLDANGNVTGELTTVTARATEFTTPESMPAKLPPNSGYTYCAELRVDGVERVGFHKPVTTWIDNFLGFPVGMAVPVGYYNRDRASWVPSDNGKVVRLLDRDGNGTVDSLDATGDGVADDLNGNGSFTDEVNGLQDPGRYVPGATFWRVQLTHFTPWDCNWPYGPPLDAAPPNPEGIAGADQQENEPKTCSLHLNSFVEERSRVFHEDIPIPGTGMTLHYATNRAEGYKQVITVPVSGASVPSSLKRIEVIVEIAGRALQQTLGPAPKQTARFEWDGRDHLGRKVYGSVSATVRIGFVYEAVYLSPGSFARAFAQAGGQVTGVRARQEVTAWNTRSLAIQRNPGSGEIARGWSLSGHHEFSWTDPSVLYKGDGSKITNRSELISAAAGNGTAGYSGDGGPAVNAQLRTPYRPAVDQAGNLYIADTYNNCIRKVNPDGLITTFAGNGVLANLNQPQRVAFDASGNVYIADCTSGCVRKVDGNGVFTTVVCGLDWPDTIAVDATGNLYIGEQYAGRVRKLDTSGTLVTLASGLGQVTDLTVDGSGNLYIVERHVGRIRKFDTRGVLSVYAGGNGAGYSGDGGPATSARISDCYGIAADEKGNLYIADSGNNRIRKVNTRGIITTIAGNGTYASTGDGGLAASAAIASPFGVAVGPAGDVFFVEPGYHRVRKISPRTIMAPLEDEDDLLFVEQGHIGHVISPAGYHKSTIDLGTRRSLYSFGYDTKELLVSITDSFGNQTVIERNSNGTPTAIVSPDGLRTELTIDPSGDLARIIYPDGRSRFNFDYTPDGLLTTKTEPNGNRFHQSFDSQGRLIEASDEEAGSWTYSREVSVDGGTLAERLTAEGNKTSYLDRRDSTGAYTSTITGPNGEQTLYSESANGLSVEKSLSCGMRLSMLYGTDSHYKFPYMKQIVESTPSGLRKTTARETTYQDTNADKMPDRITDTVTVNAKLSTVLNDTRESKQIMTSPLGRTVTSYYDPLTLATARLSIPGLHETNFDYDEKGRLTSINTHEREATFSYDSKGDLSSTTDSENHTTRYSHDAVGRLTAVEKPDGTSLGFSYDDNGNMTVLATPSVVEHGFGYNRVNINSSYETPLSGSYSYGYDLERRLKEVHFPSGKAIRNIYDKGRLVRVEAPEGEITMGYLCGTKLGSITTGTESIGYGYDGSPPVLG